MKVEELLAAALDFGRSLGADCEPIALGLAELVSDADLVADDKVPTLSIEPRGHRYVIRANPGFCAAQVRTGEDALTVLLHELAHGFRGHFLLPTDPPGPARDLQNIALDILVNALLLRRVTDAATALLERLYSAETLCGSLLLPTRSLMRQLADRDPAARALLPDLVMADVQEPDPATRTRLELVVSDHFETLGVRFPGPLARLYLDGWLTTQEPRDYCRRFRDLLATEVDATASLPLLLGGHGPGDGSAEWAPWWVEELVGQPDVAPSASTQEQWTPNSVTARAFFQQVAASVVPDPSARWRRVDEVTDRSVVPTASRREAAALALGIPPAFYTRTLPQELREQAGVHLYLDVSGSTDAIQPVCLGLAAALGQALVEPAWAFSTGAPAPMTRADIAAGRFVTTGGTDIAPVIEHALQRQFRRIVVLTDGEFPVPARLVDLARRRGLQVLFLIAVGDREMWRSTRERLGPLGKVLAIPGL